MSDDPDLVALRQGIRRLRQLLPWARAEVRKNSAIKAELHSALGGGIARYVTEDNLRALVITPAPLGGWHADLLLKKVPHGLPNTLGSPVAEPYRTREEAEEGAKMMLCTALAMERDFAATSKGEPVFLLHGYSFTLPSKVYEEIVLLRPRWLDVKPYGSPEGAAERIAEMIQELFGDEGFSIGKYNALERERQFRLIAVLYGAAASGLFAYPMRRNASPSGHAEGEISTAKH